MKLAILVKYLGTSFEGFQAQPSGNTIQQHLTSAFSDFFGFECAVTGCSRTDSGVHANGFVATVMPVDPVIAEKEWCNVPCEKLHRAIYPFLHNDIAVIGAENVPNTFHPRYDAKYKEYIYIIKDTPANDPFLSGRVWHIKRPVSNEELRKMQDVCSLFVGKHDFGAFMSKGSSVTDTVRDLKYASIERIDGLIRFTVSADGFLYNMVRIMAGTLVGIAYGEDIDVRGALTVKDRSKLGITAPPCGLYLNRVIYDPEIDFKCK
ncbi:MAG: tRNA pseudouridine synthase A [Ruminococcaceae bacterium]|nr:tRNA pseudouridine synthase A [Oscillospiraceae bacterium]